MNSQADQILEALLRGESVTPFSAFSMCGSLATHSRIAELRQRGYEIDCKWVSRNGKRYGEYSLRKPLRSA